MTPDEEEKYKKFTKSIQRRAATIGGNDMNDYPLKINPILIYSKKITFTYFLLARA